MDAAAQRDLATAHALLENPGVAAQLANALGAPIESLITKRLPKVVTRSIDGVTRRALQVAMKSALLSLRGKTDAQQPASTTRHTLAVAVSGGAGGFFGLPGLMVELPVTTTVMLRSIADIARAEGESLHDPETALACLEVLAHGGRSASDDGAESGYFAVRAAMAQQLSAAASYVAAHGFASKGAPALVSRIAAKFSVNVGEKLAVQAVPLVGAVSGATLNTVFMRHFQAMARGHFIVRRLERRFGEEAVRRAYEALPPR
ncbi:EcsC family protein [Xanthomonas campestris pv. trichodesmae]|uniref:Peptidase n=2 Tax=Xanthomonas citri TaxID=346 RepID=A0AB33C5Y7_XANCI|nr:EcsC family protein [Xanthomonas citri]ASK90204.1 peptidase [Xanthomonas citri pv. vignicola]MBV6782567.1 EcsC family protein [Xanthomonas campestris pv. trichodesmae]MBZ3919379.1 peptidase [Xanthomonas campestris pv. trichodesmae]MBZ3923910.1 peptidase [Xanthomonas citri pv. sesbaniae]